MQIIKGDKTRIVPNFANGEFFTKSIDFVGNSHYLNEKLIYASQIIRDFINSPVTVNSTYRTYLGNKNSGGANNSLHLKGEAVDLQTGSNTEKIQMEIETQGELYQKLRSVGIGGFGIGQSYIHIDTRSSGNNRDLASIHPSFAIWYYDGVKKNFSPNIAEVSAYAENETVDLEETENPAITRKQLVFGFFGFIILLKLWKK